MKKSLNNQKGMGLIEILISLVVLAIGILGFLALQYKAVEANSEGGSRVIAINIARDLAERIRVNPNAYTIYKTSLGTLSTQSAASIKCFDEYCTAAELAAFDVSQVVASAKSFGMTINMWPCQGNANDRQCIYVAWGETSATDGTDLKNCTDGTKYQADSTCLIMEAY